MPNPRALSIAFTVVAAAAVAVPAAAFAEVPAVNEAVCLRQALLGADTWTAGRADERLLELTAASEAAVQSVHEMEDVLLPRAAAAVRQAEARHEAAVVHAPGYRGYRWAAAIQDAVVPQVVSAARPTGSLSRFAEVASARGLIEAVEAFGVMHRRGELEAATRELATARAKVTEAELLRSHRRAHWERLAAEREEHLRLHAPGCHGQPAGGSGGLPGGGPRLRLTTALQ